MIDSAVVDDQTAVIKVIGVGGGGGNAVTHMLEKTIDGVEFICANTDVQALAKSNVKTQLQLGRNITKGLGAGTDPDVGRTAAIEDRDQISDALSGADMVFIAAGMGGGTGTGAAPVVAQVTKEMGILTVAVVTRPFSFEGKQRTEVANDGINALNQSVDSLIIIPNEKLEAVLGPEISMQEAFGLADDILLGAVQGIAELITCPGLINVDFADVKTVMSEMGMAMIGSGKAEGQERAELATEAAISNPLLEDVNLSGARGVLINITSGSNITMGEFKKASSIARQLASDEATVVVGTAIEPAINNEMRVTIVATGLDRPVEDSEDVTQISWTRKAKDGNYKDLDQPTVMRNKNQAKPMQQAEQDPERLDIPAFLRRQAD